MKQIVPIPQMIDEWREFKAARDGSQKPGLPLVGELLEDFMRLADAYALVVAKSAFGALPPAGEDTRAICIDCDGSGSYPSGPICLSCGGVGRLPEGVGVDWGT